MREQLTHSPTQDSSLPRPAPDQHESQEERRDRQKTPQGPLWRRVCRRAAIVLLVLPLLVILCLAGSLGFLQTQSGQRLLEDKLNALLAAQGIAIHGLRGSIPLDCTASVRLADRDGTWLAAENIHLVLDPDRLPHVLALRLEVEDGALSRLPESGSEPEEPAAEPFDLQTVLDTIASATDMLPDWVPAVEITSLRVGRFTLARSVYDQTFTGAMQPAAGETLHGAATVPAASQGSSAAASSPVGSDTVSTPSAAAQAGGTVPAAAQDRTQAPRTQVPRLSENDADAIALALHGSVHVRPGTELAWADPELGGDISLFLLPLQQDVQPEPSDTVSTAATQHDTAAAGPLDTVSTAATQLDTAAAGPLDTVSAAAAQHDTAAAGTLDTVSAGAAKTGAQPAATGIRELPMRTVMTGTALDAASCTLTLSGSLSAPQLAVETRADTLHIAGMALASPSVRLVLPAKALGSLRSGATASFLLAADTQLAGIPLGLRLQLDMQLLAERIRLAAHPRLSSQGFLLTGSLETALGRDFSLLPGEPATQNTQPVQTAAATQSDQAVPAVLPAAASTKPVQAPAPLPAPRPATAPAPLSAQAGTGTGTDTGLNLPDLESLLPALDGRLVLTADSPALLPALAQTDLKGRLQSELVVRSQDGRQHAALHVHSPQLAVLSNTARLLSLTELRLDAGVDSLALATAGLAFDMQAKHVKTSALAPVSLTLRAAGTASDLEVHLASTGGVQTQLDARIALLAGRLSLSRLNVFLPAYKCGIRSLKEVRCTFGETLSLENLALALLPAGRLELAASMNSTSLTATGGIHGIDTTAWANVVPNLPKGRIDARLSMSGTPALPTGTARVSVTDLALPVKGLPPLSAVLDASLDKQGAAKAVVKLDQTSTDALGLERFVCEVSVPLKNSNGSLSVGGNAPLRGKINIAGTVNKLWLLALQPNRRLTGGFTATADISGTLSKPAGRASVQLKDCLFKDVEYGVLIREINAAVSSSLSGSLDSLKADFDITARDGRRKKGSFALHGSTNFQSITARASLKQFAPLRRRDIRAVISADCTVSGALTAPVINGQITVDRGRIQLDALRLPASVTTLPLVEGPKEAILASRKQTAAATTAVTRPEFGGSLNLTLGVNKFFVNGYGFDSEWKARMLMRCPLANPGITGQVEAVRGSLDLLNKRFTLDEGTVKFAGGFEPLINVQMTTAVNNIEASVVVGGTPARLSLNLVSNPRLPRNDILAYMLFGKPANELSQFELLRLGTTAASFAAFGATGGSGVASFARRITGLDVLNVSQNDGSTQLEMGSYIMDKVYVGIKQGTEENADTSAVIQIELGPRTSATMETGSGSTSAGLKWKLDY